MPLTLILEDGSARPDANSYVTVDEADAYMERIPDSYRSAWLTADATQKTQVLVWATQLFDDYVYFPSSTSIRLSIAQALHFPRAGFVDYDGYVIPEHTVP